MFGSSMCSYISAVKRGLRDQYGCPQIGGTDEDPSIQVADGEYPMTINGKLDNVLIKDDRIHCCRYAEETSRRHLG